jgi:hypothetical protein
MSSYARTIGTAIKVVNSEEGLKTEHLILRLLSGHIRIDGLCSTLLIIQLHNLYNNQLIGSWVDR